MYHQAVNDHFYRMFLLLVQFDLVAQIVNSAIHAHTHIPRAPHLLEEMFILAFAPGYQRREQHDTRTFRQIEDRVDNLLHGLLAYLASTLRTMRVADASIQETQVIIHLRPRPDRRTGVVRRALLVDRDARGEAIDMINIWLLHFIQELACIGRQGLDIAALSFGKNGIKGQAALARAARASNEHRLVS